jgi:uncharacterized membrane protein YdfJ with MMPL/SSD domain
MDVDTASDIVDTIGGAGAEGERDIMNILLIIIGVVAVVLLLTGGFVQSLNFLLWVGLVLAIIAVIVWLVRVISGRRTTV